MSPISPVTSNTLVSLEQMNNVSKVLANLNQPTSTTMHIWYSGPQKLDR